MPDTAEAQLLTLESGRTLAYQEYGDPSGRPVFYFHGTPGSRQEASHAHRAGLELGFRIVAADRPGMGRSDHHKGRTLLDWPRDVLELSDHLGLWQFGVLGLSGGGPHALVCAHQIPERLDFTVVMGSWAPVYNTPLAQDMANLDRFFARLSRTIPLAFYLPFSMFLIAARYFSPETFVKSFDSSLCEADRQMLQDPELAAFFAADIREAFSQGVQGPADEAMLLYNDWDFRVEDIRENREKLAPANDRYQPQSEGTFRSLNPDFGIRQRSRTFFFR